MIQIIKNKKQAFTLIEMIIATVLFLTAMIVSVSIFLSTLDANNKVNALQKVENEIRYIVETISKEIRLGTIYYGYYEDKYGDSFENPTSMLALQDNANNLSYFTLNDGVVQMSLNDGVDWSDLSTDNILINSLDFYLMPETNPFSQDSENIKQPMIILYLEAHYNKEASFDGQIKIQTTISSRQYRK